jgi:predicted MPP superfamily phosphohydrolase
MAKQSRNIRAELTLWDLAGQPEYHLTHQLFLDDTDVALLLFDCSDLADPFRGVPYWSKVLKKHAPVHALKYLVSARTDVSPVTVDHHTINQVLTRYNLDGYARTCAKTNEGVKELMQRILEDIPWDKLPRTTTPRLFQVIREFLMERKKAAETLISLNEIRHAARHRYREREATQTEIDTVVGLLQARGLVYRLDPTPKLALILLRPELINQYASSIIQAARNHPRGIGAISEVSVLRADFPMIGVQRLGAREEQLVLESTVELLIKRDLCFREMGLLVFPSQINVTRPAPIEAHPPTEVTYQFSGSVEMIYASLVVRLSYTDYFQREAQWKYAVEFLRDEIRLGFAMNQIEEGTGELEIYFFPGINDFDRVTFIRFITDHLRIKGIDIHERIRLYCPKCGREVTNQEAIKVRVATGKLDIPCQYCVTSIIIPHSIEEKYWSDRAFVQKQQQLVETVEKRTEQEIKAFKRDQRQYSQGQDDRLYILHLSDLHLGNESAARKYRTQLEADLLKELNISRLHYLVISGDVADRSTKEEYEVAFSLVDGLVKRFGLNPSRVVVVPGNHDVNWDLSEEAYPFVPKRKLPESLVDGKCIPAGSAGVLVRDDSIYQRRFENFSTHFYKKVFPGQSYSLDYINQAILHQRPDDRILFLALNSCWELDHHYHQRASINMDALVHALDQLADSNYDDWLKIVVWHHPVTGREMMNDEFLQLLAVHGFQICMHGHIHEALEGFYKYDTRRGLHIIGAGTFGAPATQQTAGIPLQYNLLILDPKTRLIIVETRKKEKPDGAWSADARWGDKNNPQPRYTIQLERYIHSSVSQSSGPNQYETVQELVSKEQDALPELGISEIDSARRLLVQHHRNLLKLQEQAAIFGAGQAPLHLQNQIEVEQQTIDELEAKLRRWQEKL